MDSSKRKTIIKLYEDGFSEAGIAKSLGLPEDDVKNMIKRLGGLLKAPSVGKATKAEIFELKVSGYSVDETALVLDIPEAAITQALAKDKARIKTDGRAKECLELYKNGLSLEDVGNKFGITRERVRQITRKQFAFDLGYGPLEQMARKDEIANAYRSMVVEDSRSERKQEITEKRYQEAIAKGLEPKYFDSIAKFSDATGISKEMLEEFLPDAYITLSANARHKAKKWSWYYDSCQSCGTTTVKHRGYGYCANCHPKSPEFKASQQRSHIKNREANLAHNKVYGDDYFNRPEIKEKLEREYDNKYFGGNRKFALERDGFHCLGCKMSIDVKDKVGRTKVRVWHLKDKNDHSLENLGTYCQSCLFKYKGLSPRNNFGRSR